MQDREPYETTVRTGSPSLVPEDNLIRRNFFMGGWGGSHVLDHDDGSSHYQDTFNFMTRGGCKSNFGSHKNCSFNVVLGGDVGEGGRPCHLNTHQYWTHNTYVDIDDLSDSPSIPLTTSCLCNLTTIRDQLWQTANNEWSTLSGNATFVCQAEMGCHGTSCLKFDLRAFQALGMESGSTITRAPSAAEAVRRGVALLRPP